MCVLLFITEREPLKQSWLVFTNRGMCTFCVSFPFPLSHHLFSICLSNCLINVSFNSIAKGDCQQQLEHPEEQEFWICEKAWKSFCFSQSLCVWLLHAELLTPSILNCCLLACLLPSWSFFFLSSPPDFGVGDFPHYFGLFLLLPGRLPVPSWDYFCSSLFLWDFCPLWCFFPFPLCLFVCFLTVAIK